MPPLSIQLAATLAAGLACGTALPPDVTVFAPVFVSAGLLASMLAHAHRRGAMRTASLVAAGFAGASLYGGWALDNAIHPTLRTHLDARFGGFAVESSGAGRLEEPVVVEGILLHDAIRAGGRTVLRLDVRRLWLDGRSHRVAGGVSLGVAGTVTPGQVRRWTAGTRLRAPALLRRPTTYRNAGLRDEERALAFRGITLVGAVKSGALVVYVSPGTWWQERAAGVRAHVRLAVGRWLAPRDPRAAAIATAILIGDRAALSADDERAMQDAGTYHVVAISGGNVAIFAGLVLGVLGLAGWRGRGAAAIGLVTIVAYGLIAEGGASVTRATTIAVIYLAVRLIDLRTAPTQALALAASGMLLADPLAIRDVGFWLTVGASAAILLGAGRVRLPRRWWLAAPIGMLLASVAVEALLLPIAAMVFERVTLAGLALNFAAIPSMTVVQVSAMALVAADAAGLDVLAAWLAVLVDLAASVLLDSARLVRLAPWLTWRVPSASGVVVAGYYAVLAAWWWASTPPIETRLRRRLSRGAAALALPLAIVIACAPQTLLTRAGDGRLRVTMIDVGQGDSTLVTFPNGRTLLVDAGGLPVGDFDIGDRVVGPALRARGIRRLDYLAVTHGDPDHVGGAAAIVRDFSPREIWMGVPVAGHLPTMALREMADTVRAGWRTLQAGDRLDAGGATLRVLHPPPPDWERQRVRNDDSLVLEIVFGSVAVLLTGDIGRAVEREILPRLASAPIRALKVAHHGSTTSSGGDFLHALGARVAFIGVGRGNLFGHPAPGVLDRLARTRTRILRTDHDGQIDLAAERDRIEVRTYAGLTAHIR